MVATSNAPSGTMRREPRAKIRLPCRLHTPDRDLDAAVIDLSFSGAGISLPPGLTGFPLEQVHAVTVDGLGRLEATYRWKTSDRMGLSFDDPGLSGAQVSALFKARGIAVEAT